MVELLRPGVFTAAQQQHCSEWLENQIGQWALNWFSAAVKFNRVEFNQQLFGRFCLPENALYQQDGAVLQLTPSQAAQLIGHATGYPKPLPCDELEDELPPLLSAALADLSSELQLSAGCRQHVIRISLTLNDVPCALWLTLPKSDERLLAPVSAHRFTLSDAVAELTLTLQMTLPVPRVSLQQLQALQVGSVLSLQHPVDQPLALSCHDQPVLKGFLVEQQQAKALYLTSAVRSEK